MRDKPLTQDDINIYEYQKLLLGQSKTFTIAQSARLKNGSEEAWREVGVLWRYAITQILGWNAEQAMRYFDQDDPVHDPVALMLHLDQVSGKIMTGKKQDNALQKILTYAFPELGKPDLKTETIAMYEQMVSKKTVPGEPQKRYPRHFWTDDYGTQRAAICIQYVINKYLRDTMSFADLYDFFGHTPTAKRWLERKLLGQPLRVLYANKPLDYFHFSLPPNSRNEILYWVNSVEDRCRTDLAEENRRKREEKEKAKQAKEEAEKETGLQSEEPKVLETAEE